MSQTALFTGGCLCGALRYRASAPPKVSGYCCCRDCRKASGSGFIPFMALDAAAFATSGPSLQVRTPAFRGTIAVRNFCPSCGGLVYGGVIGEDQAHTVYAGSLDQPEIFQPTIAIFVRDRVPWTVLPEGLTLFDLMPD